MNELTVGAPAPEFSAVAFSRTGQSTLSLDDFRGKATLVLYFYPKDDTPGCTSQACSFRDLLKEFQAAGSAIVGVSSDTVESHEQFAEKFALLFPLLADPDHEIAEKYGVWKEKTNYGKTYMGIERTTFIIDKSGNIAKIYPRVKVEQHVEKVLEFVTSLP